MIRLTGLRLALVLAAVGPWSASAQVGPLAGARERALVQVKDTVHVCFSIASADVTILAPVHTVGCATLLAKSCGTARLYLRTDHRLPLTVDSVFMVAVDTSQRSGPCVVAGGPGLCDYTALAAILDPIDWPVPSCALMRNRFIGGVAANPMLDSFVHHAYPPPPPPAP